MENVTSSAACLRHVVFPNTRADSRRVIDLTAPGPGRLAAVCELLRRRSARGMPLAIDSTSPRQFAESLSCEERSFTGKAERVSHRGLQPLAPCVFRKDGWAA